MSWAPFALAIVFGLLVSTGIYITVMWPEVAPDDEAEAEEAAEVAAAPGAGDAAGGDGADA